MKNHIIILALLSALTALPTCKSAPEQELVLTVQFSAGDVRIVSAGGEKAARAGDVISNNDTIVTGASSLVDCNLGTKGVIRISENSSVTVAAIRSQSGAEQKQLTMKKGKLIAILSKLAKESIFSIMTPTTLAAIRGTSFMVVSDPKDSRIYVLKGRVLVQLAKKGKLAEKIEKMLEANKKVVVSEDLVDQIVAGKKQLEASELTRTEVADIRKEIKDIKASDKLDPEAQKELDELTRAVPETGAGGNKKQEAQSRDIQSIPNI